MHAEEAHSHGSIWQPLLHIVHVNDLRTHVCYLSLLLLQQEVLPGQRASSEEQQEAVQLQELTLLEAVLRMLCQWTLL